jgi:hypothetical protein
MLPGMVNNQFIIFGIIKFNTFAPERNTMTMKLWVLMFLSFIITNSFSQQSASLDEKSYTIVSEDFVRRLANASAKTEESVFLDPEFSAADIFLLTGEKIEQTRVRLNLRLNTLEIQTDAAVKLLQGNRVHHLRLLNGSIRELFVTATDFTLEGEKRDGFFKVMSDGTYKLLLLTSIEVKPSAYSTQLDAGSQEPRILKKEQWFFAKDNKLVEAEGSRKKIKTDFQQVYSVDVASLLESLDINTKRKADLLRLTQTLNQKENDGGAASGGR